MLKNRNTEIIQSKEEPKNDRYILKRGSLSKNRLQLQHSVFEESGIRFLKESGVRAGARLLEVACGPGFMTRCLAELVGPTGGVDAFDISSSYVSAAKQKTHDLPYVRIHQSDIYGYEPEGFYDCIYCRMILHHLEDPVGAIRHLAKWLVPGGLFICEEPPTCEGAYAFPTSKALAVLSALAVSLSYKNNMQYDIAYKLPIVLKESGLSICSHGLFQPLLVGEDRGLLLMGLEEAGPIFIKEELLTRVEYERLYQDLHDDLKSADEVRFSRMFQCCAVKK